MLLDRVHTSSLRKANQTGAGNNRKVSHPSKERCHLHVQSLAFLCTPLPSKLVAPPKQKLLSAAVSEPSPAEKGLSSTNQPSLTPPRARPKPQGGSRDHNDHATRLTHQQVLSPTRCSPSARQSSAALHLCSQERSSSEAAVPAFCDPRGSGHPAGTFDVAGSNSGFQWPAQIHFFHLGGAVTGVY